MSDDFEPRAPSQGPSPEPGEFKSLSHQALQTLLTAFPLVLRVAVLPFAASVAAVVTAGWSGPPTRYVFDMAHGLLVISYMASLSRIVCGTYPGPNLMAFAVPSPTWPGVQLAKSIAGEALLVVLPTMFILYMLAINFGPFVTIVGSTVLNVGALLFLEFIVATLLGLVVGAGMAKYQAENT